MSARPRNPARLVRRVSEFPTASEGLVIFHTGFDEYFGSDGARWNTLDRGGAVFTVGVGVAARSAVMIDDMGDVTLLDVTSALRPLGVVSAVSDGQALIRWRGMIHGFLDLTPGATQYASTEVGEIVEEPDETASLMRLGQAISATSMEVQLDQPVLV